MTSEVSGLLAASETGSSVDKETYETALEQLRVELLNLQFDVRHADFSIIVLIDGDDWPGCVQVTRALHGWIDARYVDTHVLFDTETEEDRARPVFWRYWRRQPVHGRIGLFLGGWPSYLVNEALTRESDVTALDAALEHVERFERELVRNGTLLLKFWLHVPKSELERRLALTDKDPHVHWALETREWHDLSGYEASMPLIEHMIRRTNTLMSPWRIIESTDSRYRNLTLARDLADGIRKRFEGGAAIITPVGSDANVGEGLLSRLVHAEPVPEQTYEAEKTILQARLAGLSRQLVDASIAAVIVFEGVDAAGKGGAIRRLIAPLPIQHVRVVPVAAPTEEERRHHYLWRFWRDLPPRGKLVVFDRSWYGRVLVERVEGFASEAEWTRAYEELNDFESSLHEFGTPVIKFWLQIDEATQLERFEARARTAYKKYKLTKEDYRNREKWDAYQSAAEEMIARTSTHYAPWTLISANDKRHARLEVLRTVCNRLEQRLAEVPPAKPDTTKSGKKKKQNRKSRS